MPVRSDPITLNGKPLRFVDIARIGARQGSLIADDAALKRVASARIVVEQTMASGQAVYGATTGVGAMKDVEWTPDQLDVFNLGLVRAHHFGTGEAFSSEIVRTAMAIRVNMALTGRVGCTTHLVQAYLAVLAHDVVPVVRRTGSIGCADIGLMGQIGAVLTGAGEATFDGRRMPASDALAQAGLKPFRLAPRDSLASISTNAVGYAAAANAIRDAAKTVRVMLATGLTTAGALGASRDPWKAVAHVGTEREAGIGAWLYFNAMGWDWPNATHIQDPLSLRMM
ncbi:aromatic amino acid lyase, partial [Devosia sp.]|uniref:aromatic amino acid lyase n=1 Tax=Devosia sp. TaxID=1871048 RepID=UPI0027353F7E